MDKNQSSGIVERVIYGGLMFAVLQLGTHFGLKTEDAAYIAAGGVTLCFGAWAWWHNRPVGVLNRAADALPDNSHLVIQTAINATPAEKSEAFNLGEATGPKVTSRTGL